MAANYGLKLWARNYRHIGEATELVRSGFFQHLEVMPEPGYRVDEYPTDIPYVIHAPKFNPGDPGKLNENRALMRLSRRWADSLKAEAIIVHPGSGCQKASVAFVNDADWHSDDRIIVENMPRVTESGREMLGATPASLSAYGRPACLDVGHMVKSALSHGADYRQFLDGFRGLQLRLAHLMDGRCDTELDQHLEIGAGAYDFRFLVDWLERAGVSAATLETPWRTPRDTAVQLGRLRAILASGEPPAVAFF